MIIFYHFSLFQHPTNICHANTSLHHTPRDMIAEDESSRYHHATPYRMLSRHTPCSLPKTCIPVAVVCSAWFLIPHPSPFPFRLKSSTPGLSRPRHACRQVIAGAVLALLRLDCLVVHVHVVLDC